MVVIFRLVVLNVDRVLLMLFLERVVVSRCKRVDIDDAPVSKNLLVDQGREAFTSESESDVTPGSCIKQTSFCWIDTFKQLHWLTPRQDKNC